MADRVQPTQEKSLPDINFKLKVEIPFSISGKQLFDMDFRSACYNNSSDVSKVTKGFFYDALGIKKISMPERDREFNKSIKQIIKKIRTDLLEEARKNLKVSKSDWNFSMVMRKRMEKYVKSGGKSDKI